jgi:hypothetical protein
MISTCVVIFLSLVAFIFWLGGLSSRGHEAADGGPGQPAAAGHPVPIAGGSREG